MKTRNHIKIFSIFIILVILLFLSLEKKKVYLINCKHDTWKIDRINKSKKEHSLDYPFSVWNCVLLNESYDPYYWALGKYCAPAKAPHMIGNIGSALAHITLWDHISNLPHDKYIIHEDNVIFTDKSHKVHDLLKHISYDFINMCTNNVDGVLHDSSKHIYKFKHNKHLRRKGSIKTRKNILLSSYSITPVGATKMLEALQREQFDLSTDIIDQIVPTIMTLNENIKSFMIPNGVYFSAKSTKCKNSSTVNCDTRNKLNRGFYIG